ncbi:hypothetical protein BTA30_00615 [Bacillus swezeyi]|uniref:MFS transporter n=1 Tax=Bacillus swezeyi TaxID=1925020 RepID=A0A1R1S385_9BACI|nr:hypothetical protein BW143_16215 [Bacillus swezeyi]OMI32747.1 hypothetical protein BTA30_00615 [Bacillus swezeyi]
MPAIFAKNWKISNSVATISVTIYWSGMVIGRALTGIVSEKLTYHRFLRLINIGSLAALAALAVIGSVWAGFALCFLIGLFMAGMFAIALIITNQFFPGKRQAFCLLPMDSEAQCCRSPWGELGSLSDSNGILAIDCFRGHYAVSCACAADIGIH